MDIFLGLVEHIDKHAAIINVVASFGLLFATIVLAIFTAKLANLQHEPQVVAVLQPTKESCTHAEISIQNTGNATAYNVEISISPKISPDFPHSNSPNELPFSEISVLSPNRELKSFVGEIMPRIDDIYTITTSWTKKPNKKQKRHYCTYTYSLKPWLNLISRESEPQIVIARELKKIRQGLDRINSGTKRIKVDVYDQGDRNKTELELKRHIERRKQEHKQSHLQEID